MFEEIYIYVPGEQQIIKISEGSGDKAKLGLTFGWALLYFQKKKTTLPLSHWTQYQ